MWFNGREPNDAPNYVGECYDKGYDKGKKFMVMWKCGNVEPAAGPKIKNID